MDSASQISRPADGQASSAPQEELLPILVDALLLDMDGTLVDSSSSVHMAWKQLFTELGSDRSYESHMHGRPAGQILAEEFPAMTQAERDTAFARVEGLEIEDAGAVTVLPGTARLLEELDAISAELGRPVWTIVTSCTRPLFDARWASTGLPAPDSLVTADQVSSGKPDPEPYLLGAQRLGVDPSAALVLEDAVGGLQSARAAGCPAIAVTTTTPAGELAPLAGALVTSLDDLEASVQDGRVRIARRGA